MNPESVSSTRDWELEEIDGGVLRFDGKGEGVFVFQATLVSADARQTVDLEVTVAAFESLYSELRDERPKDTRIAFALVTELLRAMINQWLKRTGEKKWDPMARSVIRIPYFFTPSRKWPEFYMESK